MTKQDKNMKRQKRNELRTAGYKPVPDCAMWLSADGTAYNPETKRTAQPRTITTAGKQWQTEKVVLWLFAGIQPRGGQIIHLDGYKANKAVGNLQYSSIYNTLPHETINRENLRTAIRCYFNIDRKAKPHTSDINTRLQLWHIYKVRDFADTHRKEPYFNEFEAWIYNGAHIAQNEPQQPKNRKERERQTIIAHFLNLFTSEICSEHAAGVLSSLPYHKTKRELRAKETALLHEYGFKRNKARPLRFPSDIAAGFEALGVECVDKPNFGKNKGLTTGLKLTIWLNRCIDILQAVELLYPDKATAANDLIKQIEKRISETNIFE